MRFEKLSERMPSRKRSRSLPLSRFLVALALLAVAALGGTASAQPGTSSPPARLTQAADPTASADPTAPTEPSTPTEPTVSPSPAASAALPPAGTIPANVTLEITGSPIADGAFLEAQIRAALDRQIRPTLAFGASVSYGPFVPWPLVPVSIGTRAAVDVTVTITGNDAFSSVTGMTLVTLENEAVIAPEPAVLFLSDDPEYLQSEGLIFKGDVETGRPARLYYYHSNLGLPRDLDVVLTATVPSRVALIASEAGPDLDVMSVGHTVTRDFLRYRRANEGIVVDVVPGTPLIVRHGLLLQNELIAGAVDVNVVSGGAVTVSVVASSAGGRPDAYLAGPRMAFDGHHRHGRFDLADYGAVAGSFTVGGPALAAKLGARALSPRNLDPADDGRDYGDYGVIRRVTFTLANPTDDVHRVYLYEKPLAGSVRSSFYVDGQLKELDCVRLPQPYGVMTYELAPHSTGATTTVTMTDGGSYYPLEFGVTETQPVPYPPPLGAPESCSPGASAAQSALSAAATNP